MFPIRDHNPSGSPPVLTVALIVVNVVIFLLTHAFQTDRGAVVQVVDWGMIPARITAGFRYDTLITHMFLHGSWLHLGGNMLFLWVFGDNLEDRLGKLGFILFYLGTGVAAALAQYALDPKSLIPMVGASGAIAGLLGGYVWLYPRARVDVLFIFVIFWRVFPIPAWIVLGLWFGTQLVAGVLTPGDAGGVAYWAHVGGFASGFALALLLLGREPPQDDIFGPPPGGRGVTSTIPRVPRGQG